MGKRKFLAGMSALLLLTFVLPVVAESNKLEERNGEVSENGIFYQCTETEKNMSSGYVYKKPYWKLEDGEEELEKSGVSTLPASYDSRQYGYVTELKNQGDYGTCWAFSTIAATESSLIKHGLADRTVDLSEYHLAYFSYSENADPLGNTEGDYYVPHYTLEGKLRVGGTVHDAMEQLAKWGGPVEEKQAPYSAALSLTELDKELAFQSKYHLKNAYYADSGNRESIKKLVYDHGAASVAYYADYRYLAQQNGEGTYYIPNITVANHAVCIVGWDDNFKKESFLNTPPGDGAWLCKDSDVLNSNYVWVSYYTPISDVVAVEMEDVALLDYNYQLDGCVSGTSSYSDVAGKDKKAHSFMNLFEAKASDEYLEELEAVSIHVNGNATYLVTIYVNPVINSDGKITDYAYKSAPVTCMAGEYAGIRKVEMKEPIYLNEGDWFGVEVSGADMVNYAVSSSPRHGYEKMNPGECFVGIEEKGERRYSDLVNGEYSVTPRIKAFTKATKIPCATGLLLDSEQITLTAGESRGIKASVIVPSGGFTGVTFYSSNPSIASVAANGEVSAHKAGNCEITAQCTYGNVKKTCKVQVKNVLASSLETESYVNLEEGEAYVLTTILDAKATLRTLEYISGNSGVATVDKNGKIQAISEGETKIYVKTVDGSQLTAVCQVKVDSPKKMAEAIYLSISEPILLVGQTANLVSSIYPEDADCGKIIYLVSNPTVVSVQGDMVKGLSPGTASITAKIEGSDIFASVNVQVYENKEDSSETQEQEKVQKGTNFTYKNLKYQVTSEDTVTVTGAKKKTVKTVTIPNFVKYKENVYLVTEVSEKAFYGYKKLKSVKIGKNVKRIGTKAFYGCKKLKNVTISSSILTKVGKKSFSKTKADLVIKAPKKKLLIYKKLFKKAGLGKKVIWKKK